jgi:hypothetical protein
MISGGNSPHVTSYSGGQAKNMNEIDFKPYESVLGQDAAGQALRLPEGHSSQVQWYCDMWQYFQDHQGNGGVLPVPRNYTLA